MGAENKETKKLLEVFFAFQTASILATLLFLLLLFSFILFPAGISNSESNSYGMIAEDSIVNKSSLELRALKEPRGAKLFAVNCAACHAIHKKVVGPALEGVGKKYEKEWLRKWIRDSNELIESGDPIAVEVGALEPTAMTSFPALTDADFDAILNYLQ